MEAHRYTEVRETVQHDLMFALRPEISIGVLYDIASKYAIDVELPVLDDHWLYFHIIMTKEDFADFKTEYDWAIGYYCDMDQEDGGSFDI